MEGFGKYLVLLGIILILVGIFVSFSERIPLLGKLPGDFHFKRGNTHFFFPLATSLAISLLLTLILKIVSRFLGK